MQKLKPTAPRGSQESAVIKLASKQVSKEISTNKTKGKTRAGKVNPEINVVEEPLSISELDGFFKEDFTHLCKRNDLSFIPDIVQRPQTPLAEKARAKQREARLLANRMASLRPGDSYALLTKKISSQFPMPLDTGRGKKQPPQTQPGGAERAAFKSEASFTSAEGRADNLKPRSRQGQEETLGQAGSPQLLSLEPDRLRRSRVMSVPPAGMTQKVSSIVPISKDGAASSLPVQIVVGGGGGGGGSTAGQSPGEGRADPGGKGKGKPEEFPFPMPRKCSGEDRFDSGPQIVGGGKDSPRVGQIPDEDESRRSSVSTKPGSQEVPFNTFRTTSNLLEYFKPCIQVEQERSDIGTVVKEVHIRGWKIGSQLMEVLLQSCAKLYQIHTLSLWRVALDYGTVLALADNLFFCRKLNTLILDANPLKGMPVSSLLGTGSVLQTLSLRFCQLGDYEVFGIASRLGHSLLSNSHLLHLHLSNNHITDVGVTSLASSLRVNYTLLTLNLASNRIGDAGMSELYTALSSFPLTHQQVVRRRQLLSEKLEKENLCPRTTPVRPHSPHHLNPLRGGDDRLRRQDSRDFKDRSRSFTSTVPTSLKGRKPSSKDPHHLHGHGHGSQLRLKVESPTSPERSTSDVPVSKLKVLAEARQRAGVRKAKSLNPSTKVIDLENDSKNPLLTVGKLQDGELWVRGNRTLISLNLSRNRIGKKGMKVLRTMLEAQTESYLSRACTPIGLRRLVIHGNAVDEKNEDVQVINKIVRCRHPMYRMPCVNLNKSYVTPCGIPLPF